jgi:anaerobic nitric oxide reductase transcription regulator
MSFSVDVLAKIAIELQTGIGHQDRFQRLISTLRTCWRAMPRRCCATKGGSLFRWLSTAWRRMCSGGALPWKAIRVETIARAGDVVRFPADSDLPDPYDGLIPGRRA